MVYRVILDDGNSLHMQINDVSATNLRQKVFAKDALVVSLIHCWVDTVIQVFTGT